MWRIADMGFFAAPPPGKGRGWIARGLAGILSVVAGVLLLGWLMERLMVKQDGAKAKVPRREWVEPTHLQVISPPDESVSLETPMSWVAIPGMHPDAKLCVGRKLAEQYALVMPTPKVGYAGTLQDYDKLLTAEMTGKLGDAVVSGAATTAVGGCPALRRRLEGRIGGLEVVYYSLHLEAKESYYEVLAWTLKENDAEAAPVLEKVMESFKAKEGPPVPGG